MKMASFRRALHRILISSLTSAAPSAARRFRPPPPRLARHSDPCSDEQLMSPRKPPKLPTEIRAGEGVADPRYLLEEVTELRDHRREGWTRDAGLCAGVRPS